MMGFDHKLKPALIGFEFIIQKELQKQKGHLNNQRRNQSHKQLLPNAVDPTISNKLFQLQNTKDAKKLKT